ncbi:MAG: maltose alpha-D-glucosyltransferase [Actinomycetota bacterium]|nr:maltose alpha-D-glucosyltransferase [Actinomycetota bacterium]
MPRRAVRARKPEADTSMSQWYKDAIVYELHVRAYADADGDGIGDLRGLVRKLDYLQDLGITALWLLPFYPSPLRDDGYDISMYKGIHPSYGALRDFRYLLREAHERGLQVITELVLNHTSDQHPWFQRARRAKPGSAARDFYVWSDTPDRYREARIIFQDFEHSNWTWDPVAKAYFWHRFYGHQPDLNYDNPEVRRAMLGVLDFWLDMGVDGLRLDAVPYLFEREGTTCENLPETMDFLRDLRSHVDERFPNRMLLAEANQWPEDAVAYFGKGDMCHMAFHFPLMPRMFMAIRQEDRFPIIDILGQTPPIPDAAQWALFLRNHDELTLEMVTDEERDYMYRVYAEDRQARVNLGIRRRLAPLLGNDRKVIEMMNGLLFSMPGTPVVYYGDEVGMGDNIYLGDRNGVRTPMQWSADRNAGFSRANPQRLYLPVNIDPEYHYESLNVEAQQNNPNSLLWWMKRMIALRKRYRAFGRGSMEFLYPENRKVLVFVRRYGDERILVVANLSRHAQYVELDLSEFKSAVPVELFGHTEFPAIGELPYFVTLGPHAFYWFSLEPQQAAASSEPQIPVLEVTGAWQGLLGKGARNQLEEILPSYLKARRWFGAKARRVRSAQIVEVVPVPADWPAHRGGDGSAPSRKAADPAGYLTLVRVEFNEGDPETYVLPLALASERRTRELREGHPYAVVAMVTTPEGPRALIDGLWDQEVCIGLLHAIARRRRSQGERGDVIAARTPAFRELRGSGRDHQPVVMSAEQSNTSVLFGDRFVLKIFRRPDQGVNPDLEVGRYLTARGFPHVPQVGGHIDYREGQSESMTLAVLAGFVANEGDAWAYTQDALDSYLDEARARRLTPDVMDLTEGHPALLALAESDIPNLARETIGPYLESTRRLGQRTAELHLALAQPTEDANFAPEPFTPLLQRSLYQSIRNETSRTFRLLRSRATDLPDVKPVLDLEPQILSRLGRLLNTRIQASRIRIHGDYHLGQILWTGKDFVIIDFEGEPAVPLSQRRIKHSPLRDVAGMVRSFHYAAYTALGRLAEATSRPEDLSAVEPWIELWYRSVSATFLRAYLETAGSSPVLPQERPQLELLLESLMLAKAVYELRYEANNRPEWIHIPVRGTLDLLGLDR